MNFKSIYDSVLTYMYVNYNIFRSVSLHSCHLRNDKWQLYKHDKAWHTHMTASVTDNLRYAYIWYGLISNHTNFGMQTDDTLPYKRWHTYIYTCTYCYIHIKYPYLCMYDIYLSLNKCHNKGIVWIEIQLPHPYNYLRVWREFNMQTYDAVSYNRRLI